MASKDKYLSPVVKLHEGAMKKLARIVSGPSTSVQKKTMQQSIGIYAYYQKKWQKKAK